MESEGSDRNRSGEADNCPQPGAERWAPRHCAEGRLRSSSFVTEDRQKVFHITN